MGKRDRERKARIIAGLEKPIAATDDEKAAKKEWHNEIDKYQRLMQTNPGLAMQMLMAKHKHKEDNTAEATLKDMPEGSKVIAQNGEPVAISVNKESQ